MAGFQITGKGGFHIVFSNGVTVSVQFYPGTHTQNYDAVLQQCEHDRFWESEDAEVMVWSADRMIITHDVVPGSDDDLIIAGHQTAEQVLDILCRAKQYCKPNNP